jgi:hypothetical protein
LLRLLVTCLCWHFPAACDYCNQRFMSPCSWRRFHPQDGSGGGWDTSCLGVLHPYSIDSRCLPTLRMSHYCVVVPLHALLINITHKLRTNIASCCYLSGFPSFTWWTWSVVTPSLLCLHMERPWPISLHIQREIIILECCNNQKDHFFLLGWAFTHQSRSFISHQLKKSM